MLQVCSNELRMDKVSHAIAVKVSFNNGLEFIKGLMMSIPFRLGTDHGELLGLQTQPICIRVLQSVGMSRISPQATIHWGKWECVQVEMMGVKVFKSMGLGVTLHNMWLENA